MNICPKSVITKKIKNFAKTFFVLFPATLLLAVGACDLLTSSKNDDTDNDKIITANGKFNLNEGEWDQEDVSSAIKSVAKGDTAAFSGNLTEKIIKNIGEAVKNRDTKIALDLSDCMDLNAIPEKAFYGCNKLTSIIIPSSMTSIGEKAFYGCEKLTTVTIPTTVTDIAKNVFNSCSSLTTINYIGTEEQWKSIKSHEENENGDLEYFYQITDLHLKHTAINFTTSTTKTDTTKTDTTKTDTVTTNNATFDLNKGEWDSTRVFNAIKSIPDEDTAVFTGNLTEEIIGYIGTAVKNRDTKIALDLSNCTDLGAIPEIAFFESSSLTTITMPSCVTSIGEFAFGDCSSLTSVTIPSSVTTIRGSAFSGCNGLTEIIVNSTNANYKDIGGVLFSKDGKTLIRYPASKKDTSYEMPSSVTKLDDFAFSGCTNLTSITVPESVTDIGTDAFEGCDANLDSLFKRIIYGSGNWELDTYTGDIGECALLGKDPWTADVSWLIIVFSSDTSFESNYGYIGGLRDEHRSSGSNGKFSIKENKLSITFDDQTEPFVTYSVSISNNRLKFGNGEKDIYGEPVVYLFKRYEGTIPPAGWKNGCGDLDCADL